VPRRNGDGIQEDLVVRAKSGDPEAFSELERASIGRLNALATLVLRDGDRAPDAI